MTSVHKQSKAEASRLNFKLKNVKFFLKVCSPKAVIEIVYGQTKERFCTGKYKLEYRKSLFCYHLLNSLRKVSPAPPPQDK